MKNSGIEDIYPRLYHGLNLRHKYLRAKYIASLIESAHASHDQSQCKRLETMKCAIATLLHISISKPEKPT